VTAIWIYFEGDKRLRPGFAKIFSAIQDAARAQGRSFRLVGCGAKAVRDFMIGLRSHAKDFNVLLLDSEGPYSKELFDKLRDRSEWKPPKDVEIGPDRVFWMVQLMESWFLADRDALRRFYGAGFQESAIPRNPSVEEILKVDVEDGLKRATENSKRGRYDKNKVEHALKLLETVNPDLVREAAPNCARLFKYLLSYLEQQQ
jgi:Domain of unknown function (DUF4276)